ncbi:MAG: hypothetical protein BIFFINMI_01781 [Phycisphaerae bacterium]|nr:hypothetical protein [Phycisphaerae bacterium]
MRTIPAIAMIAALLAAAAVPASADDPAPSAAAVRKGHPRIFVTPDTLAALREKVRTVGAADFATMRKADWIMKGKAAQGWSDIHNLPYPAFCWLVTGEKKYLDRVRDFLDAWSDRPDQDQYKTPEMLRAAAMAYDWTFNDLTPEQRKRYAAGLVKMADYCSKLWRHSDFNNHFVNESLSVLWAGVALSGDGIDDASAARFLKMGRAYIASAAAAANESAGEDGGQFEGFSYNDWGFARPLALTFEMWRTATGEDLFATSTFFKTQAAWHAYCLRPDTGTFVRAEDCPSGFGPGEDMRNFMLLCAARYHDPLAEWVAELAERKYVQHYWMDLLWRDYGLKARSPAELKLPTARLFARLGWVAMRSAWDDPRATFALFQCQDFFAGHQHADANSFVIHKSGSLAIDSGTYDESPHRGNYFCRSIAHNTVLVYDPAEKFNGATWGSGAGKGDGANDGGQLRPPAVDRAGQFKVGGPSDVGNIVAYRTGEHYVYVAGDATRAYSRDKLNEFTRQFVYLPPNVFICYDRVTTAKADFDTRWVVHCLQQPRLRGGTAFIREGRTTLFVAPVLPVGAKLSAVGGPGKEAWFDGRNYPPTQKKPDPQAGAWRVEVAQPRPERQQQFLVVMAAIPADSLDLPQPNGGGDIGRVEIAFIAQQKHYTIRLPRVGPLGGTLIVRDKDATGPILETADLATGIQAKH